MPLTATLSGRVAGSRMARRICSRGDDSTARLPVSSWVHPHVGQCTSCLNLVAYVTDAAVRVMPFIDDYFARSVMAAPQLGGFEPGDMLMSSADAAGGRHLMSH